MTGAQARARVRAAVDLVHALGALAAAAVKAVAFGSTVSLTGFLHAAAGSRSGVSLEAKSLGTGWQTAGAVTLDPAGGFTGRVAAAQHAVPAGLG